MSKLLQFKVDKEALKIHISVNSEAVTVKDGSVLVCLDLNDFLLIDDKIGSEIFSTKTIYDRHATQLAPLMSKEDLHDLIFSMSYEDGTSYTKAVSIKLEREISEHYEAKDPMSFGDIVARVGELQLMSRREKETV